MNDFVLIGALAILVILTSWWAIGRLIGVLARRAIVDTPNERTIHQGAVPRGGGLVISLMLVLALAFAALASDYPQTFGALAVLSLCWALLGWRDDTHDLSPKFRIFVHVILSGITVFLFGYVGQIEFNSNISLSLGAAGAVLSVLGLIWLTNLWNFMDGMDGLAASQSIVAALTLGAWSFQLGDHWLALILLLVAGACYGFLLHNWHPAKIFMGDVGSITLGAFFGAIALILHVRHGVPVTALMLIFAVFVADATLTLLRRVFRGEKIWLPHRSHYYQRLAARGINHSLIVLGYLALMILCSLLASLAVVDHDRIPLSYLGVLGLLAAGMLAVNRLEARND